MAVRSGLTVDQFWDMTASEIMIHIEAYNENIREDYKRTLYGAWHQVAFKRSKKLPDIKTLLSKLDGKKGQSEKQEVNYQKIERVAKEKGLRLPEAFWKERRLNDGECGEC